MKRRIKNCSAIVAVAVLITVFLTTISVQAQVTSAPPTSWHPPTNFVNPVISKVNEYKTMNMSDDQITSALTSQGMGWNPKTGAAWMGTLVTPDQTDTPQVADPFAQQVTAAVSSQATDFSPLVDNVEADVLMGSSYSYMGGGVYMSCGSVATSGEGTNTHYVTMHLGKAYVDGTPCWTEVGVCNYNGGLWFYTYEGNDPTGETGWTHICPINSQTYQNAYCIQLNGVHDSNGWQYNIYINQQWERSGHVQAQLNSVNYADEIFSTTGSYTIDAINAHFLYSSLYANGVWNNWNSGASFETSGNNPMPLSYNHYIYQNCYVYDAWTSQA